MRMGKVIFSPVDSNIAMSLLTLLNSSSILNVLGPGTDLARVTTREVQHMEEEAQLTCQAELFLAKVVLD